MKVLLKVLLAIALVTTMAFVATQIQQVPTQVQIIYGDNLIEMSFWVLSSLLILLMFTLYFLIRLMSLVTPVAGFQRWREKRAILQSRRFVKEALYLFFAGKHSAANVQINKAISQQPILASLLQAYFNDDYSEAQGGYINQEPRLLPLWQFLQASSLYQQGEYKQALLLVANHKDYFKKQPLYLDLAIKLALKLQDTDIIEPFILQAESTELAAELAPLALLYLQKCEQPDLGYEQLISRFKKMSPKLTVLPDITQQYLSLLVKLAAPQKASTMIIKFANKQFNSAVIDAFVAIDQSEEKKLLQLESWNKDYPQHPSLLKALVQTTTELNYTTKSQQYAAQLTELD